MLRFLIVLTFFTALTGLCASEQTAKPSPEARGPKMNGVYHGPVEIWATPEHRQCAGQYRNGEPDGKWTFWDEVGTKTAEITYRSGTFTGSVTMWHNSASGPRYRGKLKLRGSFLDGMWQGSILTYYPNGKIRSERTYVDGMVTAAYAYHPKGKAIAEREAIKIAQQDEKSDNAYVDALDEYIRKWAG